MARPEQLFHEQALPGLEGGRTAMRLQITVIVEQGSGESSFGYELFDFTTGELLEIVAHGSRPLRDWPAWAKERLMETHEAALQYLTPFP